MGGDAFRVSFHPKLGVVIYDPVAQMGLAREQMRLFKVVMRPARSCVTS